MATTIATPEPTTSPPDISGRWEGAITVLGADLAVVVNFVDEAGALTATIDVPQQGATGISLHDVRYEYPAVYFEMLEGARKATYDGQMNPDGTVNGTFSQSGVTGSFTLHRAEAP
ncbi:MAG: hypothetical protein R2844_22480, partial [Caldilineales bacterium]